MRAIAGFAATLATFFLWLGVAGCGEPDWKQVGGTRLVYEMDDDGGLEKGRLDELASAVRRRVDPTGRRHIRVSLTAGNRVEVCVPRGSDHEKLVEEIKGLLTSAGILEFRIVANPHDDAAGMEAARKYLASVGKDQAVKEQWDQLAEKGAPPPVLRPPAGETWANNATYTWFELDRGERLALRLNNAAPQDPSLDTPWQKAAAARRNWELVVLLDSYCLCSRPCQNRALTAQERDQKQYEYFALCRDPQTDPQTGKPMPVRGDYFRSVSASTDVKGRPALVFHLVPEGAERMQSLTSKNQPTQIAGQAFYRRLAIILDGMILSAPTLNSSIGADGMINGNFTAQQVDRMVMMLRAGALPAPLKPVPVLEEEVKPGKE